jgi:hypothetical protein
MKTVSIILAMIGMSIAASSELASPSKFHEQFPPGSEHLIMPPVALYSLHMGTGALDRPYLRLTLASMK